MPVSSGRLHRVPCGNADELSEGTAVSQLHVQADHVTELRWGHGNGVPNSKGPFVGIKKVFSITEPPKEFKTARIWNRNNMTCSEYQKNQEFQRKLHHMNKSRRLLGVLWGGQWVSEPRANSSKALWGMVLCGVFFPCHQISRVMCRSIPPPDYRPRLKTQPRHICRLWNWALDHFRSSSVFFLLCEPVANSRAGDTTRMPPPDNINWVAFGGRLRFHWVWLNDTVSPEPRGNEWDWWGDVWKLRKHAFQIHSVHAAQRHSYFIQQNWECVGWRIKPPMFFFCAPPNCVV